MADSNSRPKFAFFGGPAYYASGGMCDLVSTHETLDEAIAEANRRCNDRYPNNFEWWQVVDIERFRVVSKSEHGPYGSDDCWPELG